MVRCLLRNVFSGIAVANSSSSVRPLWYTSCSCGLPSLGPGFQPSAGSVMGETLLARIAPGLGALTTYQREWPRHDTDRWRFGSGPADRDRLPRDRRARSLMVEDAMSDSPTEIRPPPSPPRVVAISGIVFSSLYITSLVLVRLAVPADPKDPGIGLPIPPSGTGSASQ